MEGAQAGKRKSQSNLISCGGMHAWSLKPTLAAAHPKGLELSGPGTPSGGGAPGPAGCGGATPSTDG
jgi:hypothetical protein